MTEPLVVLEFRAKWEHPSTFHQRFGATLAQLGIKPGKEPDEFD